NRERQEFEELVACTSAPYVLRVPVAAAGGEFEKLVRPVARGATEGADRLLPMGEVAASVREATGDRDIPDRVPVGFQYQNTLLAD
ncbi:hypothetical protein, partial [Streptomyces otsuchiensis]|uniref:hypothetical protein n=1 Tax=Streptomyces otsuchiensis TaxID=2681388 RepID=UPI0013001AAE